MSDDEQKRSPGIPGIVSVMAFGVLLIVTMTKEGGDNFWLYVVTGAAFMVMVALIFIYPIGKPETAA